MIAVIMGVSGSGKTTVGQLLSAKLLWDFKDADDFHPLSNIEKMEKGIPLTDADRCPWLESIRAAMETWLAQGKNVVLACSALKESYRKLLTVDEKLVVFVYLRGNYEVMAARMKSREDHFMKVDLLRSQFDTLEEPTNRESIIVDAAKSPEQIVNEIGQRL